MKNTILFFFLLLAAAVSAQSNSFVTDRLRAAEYFRIGTNTSQKVTGFDRVITAPGTHDSLPTSRAVVDFLEANFTPIGYYTAGTGISISDDVITNSAPDQVVGLTGGGISVITGTYPNFTITSNEVDGSTTNELQNLSLSGQSLSISSGTGVTLPVVGVSAGTGIGVSGSGGTFTVTNTGDLSATNEIQTLSLSGSDLSLSLGGGTVTLPSGGGSGRDSTEAGNGTSLSGKTVQLGNAIGGTSAQLTSDRYIPTGGKSLKIGNNAGTDYVQMTGDSSTTAGQMRHKFPASPNFGFIKSIEPIVKGTQNTSFYEGISSNAQSGNNPNAVWMAGWNLSPGGSKVEAGKPYIGESWESNFRPSAPSVYPRLIEKHEIYMPSYNNVQRRLSSYTIQESSVGASFIDFYHTVDAFSIRDTSGGTYFAVRGNNASPTGKFSTFVMSAGNRALSITTDSTLNTFVITNNSLAATKSTSNFTFSGFREYNFNDYLGRSILKSTTGGGGNNVEFGTTSSATEHHFRTNSIFGAYGVYIEADVNTQTSLATRGNLKIVSGSNSTWLGQRSDINMFYLANAGSTAIRTTALQVGPAAGSSLPSAAALHVLGGGATSSTYSLIVTNSGGTTSTAAIAVRDDNAVGFGTNSPAASAKVEISSTTQGFLPPRMTTTQRNAISSPATGLTLFCTDCTATDASTGVMQTYNGSTWKNHW